MNDEIKRQIALIKGFAEAAEKTLEADYMDIELKSTLLDGYGRDIANCAANLSDMAYTAKIEAQKMEVA